MNSGISKIMKYLFLFFSTLSFGQTLNFTIKDENGLTIENCNILFKEKETNAIYEFTKVQNGTGKYSLTREYFTLEIEVQSINYEKELLTINNISKDKNYNFDFILKKKVIELEEVTIKNSFTIKKDTVVYDVAKYRDGSEKKVEDLLKKLPGIEVDSNGGIKYKGKAIETVTLDGDNLFSSNYKIGTKNINIDMVEEIEAIDNYTKNELLKGIESDGRVAINLKLKKGKSDYSGNLENAIGLKSDLNTSYYSNSYIMQISSKVKSFGTLNFNNIGRSDTYFLEKQNNKSLDKKSDDDFRTKKLISDDLFTPQIEPNRYNINNQLYVSYNNLYKFNKKISLKSNLNFVKDKINSIQDVTTINFINSNFIETSDRFFSTKKPEVFTGEFSLKINTTPSTLFEIFSKQYLEKTSISSNYTKNNEIGYINQIETNSYFSINKFVHTWKISPNKALQGNLYFSTDKIPQIFSSLNNTESIIQESEFKKSSLLFNYNLIGKTNSFSYSIQAGMNYEKNPYISKNTISLNNTSLINNNYFSHSRLKFNYKKLSIIPNLSLTNYNLSLENTNDVNKINSNNFIIEPSLDLIFKRKKTTITANYSNTKKPISEEYIFINNVFINNRTQIFNTPTLDFQNTQNYLFNYFYNNLYTNTTLNITAQFQKSDGQYLSNFMIDENITTIENAFFYEKNRSFNSNIRYSKYVEKLALTFIVGSNYIKSIYPNIVNNSDIRKNTNQIIKNSFEIRTGFNSKLNFENQLNHKLFQTKSTISNNIYSLQNLFKIRYKVNKSSKAVIKFDSFIPNMDDISNSFNFVDFELNYKLNDKINFIFIANNILNIKSFNQIQNNDFSSYITRTNLIQQYFLLNMEYTF